MPLKILIDTDQLARFQVPYRSGTRVFGGMIHITTEGGSCLPIRYTNSDYELFHACNNHRKES